MRVWAIDVILGQKKINKSLNSGPFAYNSKFLKYRERLIMQCSLFRVSCSIWLFYKYMEHCMAVLVLSMNSFYNHTTISVYLG